MDGQEANGWTMLLSKVDRNKEGQEANGWTTTGRAKPE